MKLPNALTANFGRQILHLQKASPQVMFVGGIVAGGASIVLACRSTLKLSSVLEDAEKLKAASQHEADFNDAYTEKMYTKDQTVIKVKTLLTITKLYAPSAGLAMISVALLTGSHVTLNKRNASLTAAYASVDQAFEQYRNRVKEELGVDVDRDMRYGTQEVQETIETDEGKKKTVKHTRVADGTPSMYARFFDQLCPNWKPQAEYNLIFLRAQQNYANDMLQSRGHVFLNEIYDMLGLERSGAGAVVGWVHGKSNGDEYIDFGVFDGDNPKARDFVNGREAAILLDFNVDGVINDLI